MHDPPGRVGAADVPARLTEASPRYAQVIVEVAPAHLDRAFHYRVPDALEVTVGQRVRVVFAGRRSVGWVVGVDAQPDTDLARVRPLAAVDGTRTWFDDVDIRFFRWVADRYCATLGDVLRHALPRRVAGVEANVPAEQIASPAPATSPPCPSHAWRRYGSGAVAAGQVLNAAWNGRGAFWLRALPRDDPAALAAELVARCLAGGRSALVLAPDPAAPMLDVAVAAAGRDAVGDFRDATQRERYEAFLRCRVGAARVVIGERSAVFAPLRDLGLVIVDDEANPAYKERRSPRYHARDVALARARLAGATCVVLSDLPSAALWRHCNDGHVSSVLPDRGDERAQSPRVEVLDLTVREAPTPRGRFAPRTAKILTRVVQRSGAAVVLAPRRGEGSVLVCRGCRRRRACPVCTSGLAATPQGLACRTCGWEGAAHACAACGRSETAPLAPGAGRLTTELRRAYPAAEVVQMEGFDAPGPTSRPALAVMTRGSVVDRPGWLGDDVAGAVVIPDADAMLARPTYDAAEDALRLWFAAARWAVARSPGAASGAGGHVVLQTRDPGHPAVQALVRWDPDGFWRREAPRRAELGFPPSASLVRLTAPVAAAGEIADALRAALPSGDVVLGPAAEGDVLVQARVLRATLDALRPLRDAWARDDAKVRIDVDPVAT